MQNEIIGPDTVETQFLVALLLSACEKREKTLYIKRRIYQQRKTKLGLNLGNLQRCFREKENDFFYLPY